MRSSITVRSLGAPSVAALAILGAIVVGLVSRTPPPSRVGAVDAGSCGGPIAPIVESPAFTAYEEMQSHLVDVPINPTGAIAKQALDTTAGVGVLDSLPLQFAVVGADGTVSRYFGSGPVARTVTEPEFMAQRGIEFDRFPRDPQTTGGATSFAAGILKTLGDRVIAVSLGTSTAALTWADPASNGVRTHNLYWADAQSNFALIADRPAAELVAIAQSIICP